MRVWNVLVLACLHGTGQQIPANLADATLYASARRGNGPDLARRRGRRRCRTEARGPARVTKALLIRREILAGKMCTPRKALFVNLPTCKIYYNRLAD